MRHRLGGHASGDEPYVELPKVTGRPAVGARRTVGGYPAGDKPVSEIKAPPSTVTKPAT